MLGGGKNKEEIIMLISPYLKMWFRFQEYIFLTNKATFEATILRGT